MSTLIEIVNIRNHLQKCKRIDLVWDVYVDHSMKSSTRQKRSIKYLNFVSKLSEIMETFYINDIRLMF